MNCLSPVEIWPKDVKVLVPCGKCLVCLSHKRTDWAFRLNQELKVSKSAHFVTLTYSPKFCPEFVSKRHIQLFLKRLRKRVKDRVRYYAVGEYGSKYGRPHYHLILFNADETTVRQSWKTKSGEDFGQVHVGKVTPASISYALKYVVQPSVDGKFKPFAVMSRGYGLGLNYLTDEMAEWHRQADRNYTIVNGVKNRLPRYYKEKIWYHEEDRKRVSDLSKWQAIKANRQNIRRLYEIYGKDTKRIMAEMRNALLSRIKTKVAFTQTF